MQKLLSLEQRLLHKKITKVKREIKNKNLKKTGYNGFNKYHYFQLEDITPTIIETFFCQGLSAKFEFTDKTGRLLIIDDDTGAYETWETPITRNIVVTKTGERDGDMKGVQALQTYARRALYLQALEITEPIELEMTKTTKKSPIS